MVRDRGFRLLAVVMLALLSVASVVTAPAVVPDVARLSPPGALAYACPQPLGLQNGSFETPIIGPDEYGHTIGFVSPADVIWSTTGPSGTVEIWNDSGVAEVVDIQAYDGDQFAEINARNVGQLYQDLDTSTLQGQTLAWSFAHHARVGTDVMGLYIGRPGSERLVRQASDNVADGWVVYSGTYTVPIGQMVTRFGYRAISTGSGDPSVGNFLDAISFGTPGCSTDLSVEKTTTQRTFTPGGAISYTITIRNTGAEPGEFDVVGATLADTVPADITDVTWTCDASSGSACGEATGSGNEINTTYDILEGGTITYRVTGTVSGSSAATALTNTATVSLPATSGGMPIADTNPDNNTDRVTLQRATLGISLDKISDYYESLVVGQTVPYIFLVTNTGQIPLANVTVTDSLPGLSAISPASWPSLAPGETAEFTASYVITQDDVDHGTLTNAAVATGDPPATCLSCDPPTAEDTETIPGSPEPLLKIEKTSDNPDTGELRYPGDLIRYTYTVTNIGNVTATNVTVTDPMEGLSEISPAVVDVLYPGDVAVFTAEYVVTETEDDSGVLYNAASANATPPSGCVGCGDFNEPTATLEVILPQHADLAIIKQANDGAEDAQVGDVITFTFVVENTGNVGIEDVTIDDDMPELTWITGPNLGRLGVGDTVTAVAQMTVGQGDYDNGGVYNVARVVGTPDPACTTCDPIVRSPEDIVDVRFDQEAALTIVKSADTEGPVTLGDEIIYAMEITNTGNVVLTNVTVADSVPNVTWIDSPQLGELGPGDSATITASYVVSNDDVLAGSIVNTASVIGEPPGSYPDDPPEATSNDVVIPVIEPTATATATATATLPLTPEPTATFPGTPEPTATLPGTPEPTATFPGTPEPTATLPGTPEPTATFPGTPEPTATLPGTPEPTATFTATSEPTATFTATSEPTATFTATSEPTATFTATSEPTATYTATSEPTATFTSTPEPVAALEIAKDASPLDPVNVGDVITYTFTVTNTGNVPLDDVTVVDEMAGLIWVVGPNVGSLAPGESASASATYTVTAEDVARGSVDNLAVAAGEPPADSGLEPPISPPDEVDVPAVDGTIGLSLDKIAAPDTTVVAGDTILYTFVVTNIGTLPIDNIAVSDSHAGLGPIDGPFGATLQPGESATFTATYVVTAEDVATGSVANVAVASGTGPGGEAVEGTDGVEVRACDIPMETPSPTDEAGVAAATPIVETPEPTATLVPCEPIVPTPTSVPTEVPVPTQPMNPTPAPTQPVNPTPGPTDAPVPTQPIIPTIAPTSSDGPTTVPVNPTRVPTQSSGGGNDGGGGGITTPISELPNTGQAIATPRGARDQIVLLAAGGLLAGAIAWIIARRRRA